MFFRLLMLTEFQRFNEMYLTPTKLKSGTPTQEILKEFNKYLTEKKSPIRDVKPSQIGKLMKKFGYLRRRTNTGSYYLVKISVTKMSS